MPATTLASQPSLTTTASASTSTMTMEQAVQQQAQTYLNALTAGNGELMYSMYSSGCKATEPKQTVLDTATQFSRNHAGARILSLTASVEYPTAVVYAVFSDPRLTSNNGVYWRFENGSWAYDNC